jgi:thiopurine S-methyltransferase
MDPDFWKARWAEGQIGFHQSAVNPRLEAWWTAVSVDATTPVLVPLCGKSLDLWWLRGLGHPVLGVELSPLAVEAFFAEAGIERAVTRQGPFEVSEGGGVRILCGDVFDLRSEDLASVGAVYDRAALVALPAPLRKRYTAVLAERLPRAVKIFLLSFETTPHVESGPPFSVPEAEVRALHEPAFTVTVLHRTPLSDISPAARARGVESLIEVAYRIER